METLSEGRLFSRKAVFVYTSTVDLDEVYKWAEHIGLIEV